MKKILALILAIAMVISLVPMAFAVTVAENGNTVYNYVFSAPAIGLQTAVGIAVASGTSADQMVSAVDGGVVDYDDIVAEVSDKWDLIALRSAHARELHMNGIYFRALAGNVVKSANGIAIKINVPENGKYIPGVVFDAAAHGGIAEVYLGSTDDYTIENQYGIRDFINSGKFSPLGTVDTYAQNGVDAKLSGPDITESFAPIDLKKGDYYLVFTLIGGNDKIKTDGALPTTYMETKSFSLEKIAPVSVSISTAATEVEVGKTVAVTASAYSADAVALPDEIVYSSSNDKIASVDPVTGVVTANAFGVATITATVKGTNVKNSVDVKVVNVYEYRFSYEAFPDLSAKSAFSTERTYADIDSAVSQPWQYLSARTGTGNMVKNGFYYAAKEGNGNHPLANNGLAFKIKVKESGVYTPVTVYSLYRWGSKLNTYIITPDVAQEKGWNFASGVTMKSSNVAVTPVSAVDSFDTSETPIANENFATVSSVSGTPVSLAEGECYVVFAIDGANANEAMTYADHYMLIQSLKLVKTDDYTPPSSEKGEEIKKNLSFAVLANYEAAKSGVTADKVTVGYPASLAAGTKVKAAASDVEGYKFSHWKLGSKLVGTDNEIEYTVVSNGALVAVYDKEEADSENADVEFYNENGALIEKKTAEKGTTFAEAKNGVVPALTGYTFDTWSVSDSYVINKLTRAVALYERTNVTDDNSAGEGNAISGKVVVKTSEGTETYTSPNYNSEITATTNGAFFSHWTRDGKIVSYDKTYTFRVWGATNVTAVYAPIATAKVPTVILDATAKNDAYMIEYNVPAGFTKVEAGILFGKTEPTITGFYTKAASKSSAAHGQFTAERNPNEDADMQATARGYLIYKDASGNIKVAYSD